MLSPAVPDTRKPPVTPPPGALDHPAGRIELRSGSRLTRRSALLGSHRNEPPCTYETMTGPA